MSNCHTRSLIFELPYNFFCLFYQNMDNFRDSHYCQIYPYHSKNPDKHPQFQFHMSASLCLYRIVLRYQKIIHFEWGHHENNVMFE